MMGGEGEGSDTDVPFCPAQVAYGYAAWKVGLRRWRGEGGLERVKRAVTGPREEHSCCVKGHFLGQHDCERLLPSPPPTPPAAVGLPLP